MWIDHRFVLAGFASCSSEADRFDLSEVLPPAVALLGILATLYLGLLTMHRWKIKQQMENWSVITKSLDAAAQSLDKFHRVYWMSKLIGLTLDDQGLAVEEKKQRISILVGMLPDDLPDPAMVLADIRMLVILGLGAAFDLKTDAASTVFQFAVYMTLNSKGLLEGWDNTAVVKVGADFHESLKEAESADRKIGQWLYHICKLDQQYRDWLHADSKWIPIRDVSFEAFRLTKDYMDLVESLNRSSTDEFYEERTKKILDLLDSRDIAYTTEHHEPTVTSEEASRIRGVSMHAGAKALVLRGEKTKQHWLFVMPADLRADTKKIALIVGERVAFAPEPEAVTGCVKGSVPPFGSVIGLKTYCDARLAENEIIHFNAGSLTDSVSMRYEDYIAIERPEIVDITQT